MKNRTIISIAAALLCLAACKGPNASLRGSYSFKTAGYLDIKGKAYTIVRDTVSTDTTVIDRRIGQITVHDTIFTYHTVNDTLDSRDTQFIRHLVPESGQMHIVQAGDALKLTLNVTGGGAAVYDAAASGDRVALSPVMRRISVSPDGARDSDQGVSFLFETSGSGQLYENMLIISMDYKGEYSDTDLDGTVNGSFINCIATKNE